MELVSTMSAEGAEIPVVDMPLLAIERWATVATQDRKFWIALAAAALLHMAFLINIAMHGAPRHLGDASGSDDGISISVVTEADIQSHATVPEIAEPPPGALPTAAPQPDPQQWEAKTEEAKPDPQSVPEAETAPPAMPDDMRQLLAIPLPGAEPAKKTPPPKPQQPAKPQQREQQPTQQRTAKLDFATPPSALNTAPGFAGRFTGATRPPGTTRSGANDDFARHVIAELQKTMPQLRQTLGRCTVRIFLNQNGNVSEVQVIRPSSIANIDQSVVFAVRQTSFPFPPPNSNEADRTFFVTYIYN